VKTSKYNRITDGHRVGVWFPRHTVARLQAEARRRETSLSNLIRSYTRWGIDHDERIRLQAD
jgi:hypothetical protein